VRSVINLRHTWGDSLEQAAEKLDGKRVV
jgi:hypothetical protein